MWIVLLAKWDCKLVFILLGELISASGQRVRCGGFSEELGVLFAFFLRVPVPPCENSITA